MRTLNSILMLGIFFFSSLDCTHSQKASTAVAVSPFDYSRRSADPLFVSMIYDHTATLLNNTPNVTLVGRGSDWIKIYEEQELLKTEPFILSETVEQGKMIGAEKLLVGKIYLTDVKRESSQSYSVSFSIYLGIVNVETGLVEDNIMVTPEGIRDVDKMVKIVKKTRYLLKLPPQLDILKKIIKAFEFFDLVASQTFDSGNQQDAFQKALVSMDKHVVPFLNYHFAGQTNGYSPSNRKKAEIKEGIRNPGQKDDYIPPSPTTPPATKKIVYEDEYLATQNKILVGGVLEEGQRYELVKIIPMGDGNKRIIKEADLIAEEVQGDVTVMSVKNSKSNIRDYWGMDNLDIRLAP